MPRNAISKDEIKCRVLKLKKRLDYEHPDKSGDWHRGANYELNNILDILDEYRF
jgi:hypothetical protein